MAIAALALVTLISSTSAFAQDQTDGLGGPAGENSQISLSTVYGLYQGTVSDVDHEVSHPTGDSKPWGVTDPPGDNNRFSTGENTGLSELPGRTDILGITAARIDVDFPIHVDYSTPENPVCSGEDVSTIGNDDDIVFCELRYDKNGKPKKDGEFIRLENGLVVWEWELAGPVIPINEKEPDSECEWMHWLRIEATDIEKVGYWVNRPAFPNDPAAGTNRVIGVRWNTDGIFAVRKDLINGEFTEVKTNTSTAFSGNDIAVIIPMEEVAGATQINSYAFCTYGGYTAADSTSDQTGLTDISLDDLPTTKITSKLPLTNSGPEVVPAEASPAAAPDAAATATETANDPIVDTTADDDGADGGFPTLPVSIAAVLFALIPVAVIKRRNSATSDTAGR